MTRLVPAAIAASFLVACAHPASAPVASAPVSVTLAPLRYTQISTPIDLSGSLAAVQSVTVGAIAPGRVVRIDVRVGDVVRAGDIIAQVDDSASAAALAQARAASDAAIAGRSAGAFAIDSAASAAAAANAQLAAARSRDALAATTAARMASLYSQGAVSLQQRDQAASAAAEARAAVTASAAGAAGARQSIGAAREQYRAAAATATGAAAGIAAAGVAVRDATLSAPFGGTIVNKFVEPGAVVGPGSPIVTLQNARDLEVNVAVPDDAAAGLVPGTPIEVHVDAAGSAPIPARIRAIVASENPALRSSTLKIAVPARSALRPGMFARVTIVTRTHSGWTAPLGALAMRAGQSGIFAVHNGIATYVPVQTGATGPASIELLGFSGGATQVVVGGLERLTDGSRVTVAR